jgi:hypothetical protein
VRRSSKIPAAALVAAAAFSTLLTGCASGPSGASKKTVNAFIAQGNYDAAQKYIEGVKETQYGKKNMVLFYLDKATVLHHAGKFKESDQAFDVAERRIEELYTKSISQAAGMLLLNDTTMEYAGEPFERALTNVFRALNYVFLGKPDEALVESRKVEQFLDELGRKLEGKTVYKDDAFARYLDSLLYLDAGKKDDARISMDASNAAYGWYTSMFATPQPRFEFPAAAKDAGELVFIHYNGVAPRKVSKTWQIAWNDALIAAEASKDAETENAQFKNGLKAGIAGKAVTVAYPDYVQDPFRVVSSEVEVTPSIPVGVAAPVAAVSSAKAQTMLMEDISAIARRTLQDRMALIKTRAIARATVKFVLAEQASKAAAAACDKQYAKGSFGNTICKGLSKGVAHGAAAASEIADTRGWSALPSQIRMARLRLPPGQHDVVVRFLDAGGAVVATQTFKGVKIDRSRRTYLSHRTAL